jgi:hypothetical protein
MKEYYYNLIHYMPTFVILGDITITDAVIAAVVWTYGLKPRRISMSSGTELCWQCFA